MARLIVFVLFLVWAALVVYGGYAFATTAPADIGFTMGLNRAGELFKWQGFALGVAIIAWVYARSAASSLGPGLRWAGRLPLLLSGSFFVIVILLIAGAAIFPEKSQAKPS